MPMPDNGFKWRPNDNSATTNLRYTLEAEKWVSAVASAQRKSSPRSMSGDLAFIGLLLELVFSVTLLILLGLLQLITAVIRLLEISLNKKRDPKGQKEEGLKLDRVEKKPDFVWDMREKRYPSGWQLIFWTSWGELRSFWKFIYLWIAIFLIEVAALFILAEIWPEHLRFYRDTVIFAAVLSLFFAFTGMDD
ncbi:hypothetical protein [Christiangramia sabulilitoris]|uniref:Uncharacterized protein n=1 Tax=Christiangramia sabulilitoris TaxID=2583991 RepID=A0A550I7M6_9FLAO|nr:hypothetical protein [Christiangramia sabulilitoris]TRO66967.1 hypothetical protein FGM01_03495 [Christiangramia sabulilitoris]